MTAIFAFVFDNIAVLATDSLRVDPLGLFPNQTVQKSYCWKAVIPFGATGTGAFVKRAVDEMAPREADYGPDRDGFLTAFEQARKVVVDAIQCSSNPLEKAVVRATVLAAVPALSSPAHILSIDFATGAVEPKPLTFAADGTLPSEFHAIAEAALASCTAPLDPKAIALDCMERAINICPEHVGWPMDIWITKSGADAREFHAILDPRTLEGR